MERLPKVGIGEKVTFSRYLDDIVSNCLLRAVAVSLGYLLDQVQPPSSQHFHFPFLVSLSWPQTEEKKNPEPLFLAEMELLEPDIIFRPSLNKAIFNNFFTIFTGLIDDIFQMAELVPRIHKVSFSTAHFYLGHCSEERDVFDLLGNSSESS